MGDASGSWWSAIRSDVLAQLDLSESAVTRGEGDAFLTLLPEPWHLREGSVVVENAFGSTSDGNLLPTLDDSLDDSLLGTPRTADATKARTGRDRMLKATSRTKLCAGNASWSNYVVTAEVMLGAADGVTLSAANSENGDVLTTGYHIAVRGQADETVISVQASQDRAGDEQARARNWDRYYLRPDPRRLATTRYTFIETPMSEEDVKKQTEAFALQEARPDQFWNTKWLRLRVEVTEDAARLWLDGVLIGWVEGPERTHGSICLEMNRGDRVRLLRVQRVPAETRGSIPLDLSARFNCTGVGDGRHLVDEGLPGQEQYIMIGGVPFLWTSGPSAPDNVDIGQVTVTGGPRYIQGNAFGGEYKHRVLLRVPSRQYNEVAIIAATDMRPDRSDRFALRMFVTSRAMWVESESTVPDWNAAAQDVSAVPLPVSLRGEGTGTDQSGRLWLLRIPLDPGTFQNFIALEGNDCLQIDLTGDSSRSGVHVFAATLIESPVQMKVQSSEIGHVFVEPQVPTFDFMLRNATPQPRAGKIAVAEADFYGNTNLHEFAYAVAPHATTTLTLPISVDVRGLHDLDARLLNSQGETLIRRRTTFASLPPDTRQADMDSPFGLWTFNSGHYGAGPEASSSLLHKLGARYSLHYDPTNQIYGGWYSFRGLDGDEEDCLETLKTEEHIRHWTLFAETALGGGSRHFARFPTELLENPKPLELNAAEEAKFRHCWDSAVRFGETVRKFYPQKKLVLGNGYPQFVISFLERGFPRKYLNGISLDFLGERMNMFFYLRQAAKHYGYGDVPLFISEGFYVGSGRGFHPDRQSEIRQSDRYIRGFLRGFAMGMERYLGSSEIWDNGGDYYLSGYGPVGLCHRAPEVNPKPGFTAYATMTLLLDRAPFHSVIPTGSLNVYMLRFDGREGPVYAMWSEKERRRLSFVTDEPSPIMTDGQANDFPLASADGRFTLEATASPIWIRHAGVIRDVLVGLPLETPTLPDGAHSLYSFGGEEEWTLDDTPYEAIDALDHSRPVCVGRFTLGSAEGKENGRKALAVTLHDQPGVSDHRMRYAAVRPPRALAVPAEAEALGVWVYGNGAVQIDLELQDAEGETWHTVRGPASYSFGITSVEPFMFDGWRYFRFALPPRRRAGEGNGKPDAPFALTGILTEQYAKVIHVNHLQAPADPTWRIGSIFWE